MRAFEERPESADNSPAIDRLVDGDLSEPERRELLLQLENDPEGWRRCALAFLEDQALRQALAAISPALAAPVPLAIPARLDPNRAGKSWRLRASIAATLLASTFAAGFGAGGWSMASPRVEVAKEKAPAPVEAPSTPEPGEVHEVGSFELVDGSAGETPPTRFPIYSGRGLDERWLKSQPPSVPDYLRARWERQGYQVAEQRKLVSVELEDGRHVSIPVDEVKVDYVGQKPL